MAPMVADHRHSGGLRSGCALRPIRRSADTRCVLGGCSLRLMAGTRPESRCGVLGAAAGVRGGHAGGGDRDGWGRSSHSKGLPTQAAGDRLPGGAGRPERRRRGQSAVGHFGNPPQYDLLDEHLSCRGYGNRRTAGGRRYRRHLLRGGLLPQVCCLADRHTQPRWPLPT